MVALRLELEGLDTLPDGGPTSFEVKGRRTVEIGRNTFLDWTLPDPDRVVSGKHCEITWRDGAYVLTDLSTNGTFVNNSDARITEPRRLRSGDRISIGRYHIRVVVEDDDAPAAPREAPPADPVRPGFGGRHTFSSLWDVPPEETAPPAPVAGPTGPGARPVHADMLDWVADIPSVVSKPAALAGRAEAPWTSPTAEARPSAPWPADVPEPAPAESAWPVDEDVRTSAAQPFPATDPAPTAPQTDTDAPSVTDSWPRSDEAQASSWPRLGGETASDAPRPMERPTAPDMAPADDHPPAAPVSDNMAGIQEEGRLARSATGHPFVPAPAAAPGPAAAAREPAALPTPAPAASPPERTSSTPDLVATEMPRRPSAETAFTADPALARRGGAPAEPAAPAPTTDGDLRRFVSALSAELGVAEGRLAALPPERLGKLLGRFMRRTVEGLHELLRARSAARGFMRSGRGTMVEAIGNNPLKFMPTNAALEVLLAPSNNAYLDADATLDDSFRDLSAHQVAVYVAMQAALTRLLSDIEPSVIEAADDGKASGGLLGGGANAKKARLWDLYKTRYTARAEAHDKGMVDVFMLYFADAYERAARDEDARRDRVAAGHR